LEPCFALLCSMMMESCTESWKPILAVAGKKKKMQVDAWDRKEGTKKHPTWVCPAADAYTLTQSPTGARGRAQRRRGCLPASPACGPSVEWIEPHAGISDDPLPCPIRSGCPPCVNFNSLETFFLGFVCVCVCVWVVGGDSVVVVDDIMIATSKIVSGLCRRTLKLRTGLLRQIKAHGLL
jgi:hypothetical protein